MRLVDSLLAYMFIALACVDLVLQCVSAEAQQVIPAAIT